MAIERALVLSGGSIKGAFQAGAIAALLETGWVPDAIYGTSVGSLNGAFLADRAGRAVLADQEPDWQALGQELEEFWRVELKSPAQVGTQRRTLPLIMSLLRQTFTGLIDTSPLQSLVARQLKPEHLRASPVKFYACSVNLVTGETVYADQDYSGILDYVVASTAIPIEMPYIEIGKSPYVDGGVREVAPLSRAIEDDAQDIVCIVCQPEDLQGVSFRPGSLPQFALRLMDVVTNELINNDLDWFDRINSWVATYDDVQTKLSEIMATIDLTEEEKERFDALLAQLPFNEWRQIPIKVIRPENEIVLDLLHFKPAEIAEVIAQGRNIAKKTLT
jgi:NTE family protein